VVDHRKPALVRQSGRQWRRFRVYGVFIAVCFAVLCGIYFFIFCDVPQEPFIAVAVSGSPASVVFVDRNTNSARIISIPVDATIDTSGSYGTYPITSLWRLGEMEKRGGGVFSSTLGSALGIPIRYYLGSNELFSSKDPAEKQLSDLFSLPTLVGFVNGTVKTNMPIGIFLSIISPVSNALSSDNSIDLAHSLAISETEVPDGTSVAKINPDGVDLVMKQSFELPDLRNENIRVIINNTTNTSGLGQKIARMLSHVGINVVAIDSEDTAIKTCEVVSQPQYKQSLTVRTLLSFFSCRLTTSEETKHGDVLLRLGESDSIR